MKSEPSYYSILTAEVRYDKTLTGDEKVFFSEIAALANESGYCCASNAYFSELYGKHKNTISNWLRNLKDCGYVRAEYVRNKSGEIVKRKLYPLTQS